MKAIRGWTGAVLGALLGGSVVVGQTASLPTSKTAPDSPVVTITTEPLLPTTVSTPAGTAPRGSNGAMMPTGMQMPAPSAPVANWLSPPTDVLAPSSTLAPAPAPVAESSPILTQPGPVEAWLNHNQPGCCGPVGGDGPISYDLYLRTGFSFPTGGGMLSQVLEVGWVTRGGARTLFFNPTGDSAFVIDANLEFTRNNGTQSNPVAFFGQPVTVRGLSRSSFGLAVGKEWYTRGPGFITGDSHTNNLSYGFDVGGRWGAAHVDYLRIRPQIQFVDTARQYDVFGGMFGGFNVNYEMPMGGWTFLLGGRLEGAMTFTDVLQGYGGTLYDVNLMLSTGIRY